MQVFGLPGGCDKTNRRPTMPYDKRWFIVRGCHVLLKISARRRQERCDGVDRSYRRRAVRGRLGRGPQIYRWLHAPLAHGRHGRGDGGEPGLAWLGPEVAALGYCV